MKIRLVFETEIETPEVLTTDNIINSAVNNLFKKTGVIESDPIDPYREIFKKMTVNGSCKAPGFK